MLKAIRISTSTYRTFSSVIPLVAQPAKLQKQIHYKILPLWLHKDVKAATKSVNTDVSSTTLTNLATQAYTNTEVKASQHSILQFCNECIIRLGLENFKRFVKYHEYQMPTFSYLKNFQVYLATCYKLFNHDLFLLNLLAMCDFKRINTDSISRVLGGENEEGDNKLENQHSHIFKMVPQARLAFDDYHNLAEKKESELVVKVDPREELLIKEEEGAGEEEAKESVSEEDNKKFIMDTILTFYQKPSDAPKVTNWLYFQIESGRDELLTEERLMKTFKSLKIPHPKNLLIYNVSQQNAPRIQFVNMKISSEDIKKSLSEEIDLQRLSTLAKSNLSQPQKKPADADAELSGDLSSNTSEIEKNTKKFEDMITFCSRNNVRNKAYGFVELEDYETKERVLNQYYRLFGVEYDRAFLVIDDADRKKVIQLNNMPWNLSPKLFCDWLHYICKDSGAEMQFDFDPNLEKFLSDASYFYIESHSFLEALKIVQYINVSEYNERKIYANFKRGCGRYVNGIYFENFISPYQERQQKQHIERRTRMKEAFVKKISENLYSSLEDASVTG